MQIKNYLFLGACILAFGCGKNDEALPSVPEETILTATSSQVEPESKVSIDEATATSCT